MLMAGVAPVKLGCADGTTPVAKGVVVTALYRKSNAVDDTLHKGVHPSGINQLAYLVFVSLSQALLFFELGVVFAHNALVGFSVFPGLLAFEGEGFLLYGGT